MACPLPCPQQYRLTEMNVADCGRICAVGAVDEHARRLVGLGICPGRVVELFKTGDPLILCVYGTKVALSRALAHQIHIEALPAAALRG